MSIRDINDRYLARVEALTQSPTEATDEKPSQARDLAVAALGMAIVLFLEIVACALAPAPRRQATAAPCVMDARKGVQF